MRKIIIFGNSGAGKSTLAKQLAAKNNLAHLDLDTIAWLNTQPPQRMPVIKAKSVINSFIGKHDAWIIEGCYSDLLETLLGKANEAIFLNLSVEQCIANAKRRPWEPHKYESKQAQDANLAMLIDWIKQYPIREDTFSLQAHEQLFARFEGDKTELSQNID